MSAAGGGGAGQFGDTTFTKVFVGGLAWETHKEGMRAYFEQFGDILEAVVITDKNTGRSKGYGFVTFREPEAALRACIDPYPVIDGRRANCNLAYLGVNKSKTTPVPLYLQPYAHFHGGGNMRAMKSIQTANGVVAGTGGGASLSFVPADYGIQQGIPTYNVYAGYSPYFSDYGYPLNYSQAAAYGGLQGGQQYAVLGGGATAAGAGLTTTMASNPTGGFYPYFQYGPATAGYSMAQYPQSFYQYAAAAMGPTTTTAVAGGLQQYGGAVALSPNSAGQAGMTMSLTAPTLPASTTQYQFSRLIPSHLAAAPDQKPSLA
ncbi:hypothetical protein PR202_ga08249 [Eleusine coracana subsp. coracana]|uniref:RRM domain-containing protein n=1 Tax=Eleusine coracana subsp. coracana TaxID=191504 RepID=A0AAV5C0T4_ELECO|nr:hypothetical protein QOZ80_1AG0047250 [Eleusine coracana subsp. coracana]GJM91832.1 hypothetical protein PR202_ga08249 [Eleusine coracana subsp. coracana]